MELLTLKEGKKNPTDEKSVELINKLKQLVHGYDNNAELILFGSKARGDWHDESDWDFLMLTDLEVTEELKSEIRNTILDKIELPMNEGIFIIVKNKFDWEENNNVTPLYYNIIEEGIRL